MLCGTEIRMSLLLLLLSLLFTAPYMFLVHVGLFFCFHNPSISGKDQKNLLTSVRDLFACKYTRGTSLYSLIQSTFAAAQSALNFDA